MHPTGAEQSVEYIGDLRKRSEGGAKGGPCWSDLGPAGDEPGKRGDGIADDRLALIVARWEGLSEATRAQMVSLAQEAPTVARA